MFMLTSIDQLCPQLWPEKLLSKVGNSSQKDSLNGCSVPILKSDTMSPTSQRLKAQQKGKNQKKRSGGVGRRMTWESRCIHEQCSSGRLQRISWERLGSAAHTAPGCRAQELSAVCGKWRVELDFFKIYHLYVWTFSKNEQKTFWRKNVAVSELFTCDSWK